MTYTQPPRITFDPLFDPVQDILDEAILAAWDGCHKIYLALDEDQAQWFQVNYPHWVRGSDNELLNIVGKWYEESCGLRFVSGVRSKNGNPNDGDFVCLVEQFADQDDDQDDDE